MLWNILIQRLLNKRRAMEFEKDGLGEASYQVPERSVKLNERWNVKIVKHEQEEVKQSS